MNDAGKAEIKERDLEKLLEAGRGILHRIGAIQGRLCEMETRLHGELPEVDGTSADCTVAGGILGQFQEMHGESDRRCGCIEEWISRIESAV